ncbi:putative Bgh specific protein [Blumeria hordei DH14]|uniref:Putative Bgh specific protein n=1 Tax=Blumeria graminis f. sp. hordei (strain DH14) TaxID=546991 RepID=N1J4T0_BLUG1|nr:putative Bgh specific protein [Blumeria hordei DH14]
MEIPRQGSYSLDGTEMIKSGKNSIQAQNLAEIQAAMMEELGIKRKDALPLEDLINDVKIDEAEFLKELKSPKKNNPGVTAWQNIKFDDINPAESEIDSIADGQLARIRRRALSFNDRGIYVANEDKKYLRQGKLGPLNEEQSATANNESDKKENWKQESISGKFTSFMRRNSDFPRKNLSQARALPSGRRQYIDDSTKIKMSINRLRESVAGSHKLATEKKLQPNLKDMDYSVHQPKESPLTRSQTIGQKYPTKHRALTESSAWGKLDEDAFLAFAIQPKNLASHLKENNGDKTPTLSCYASSKDEKTCSTPKSSPKKSLAPHDTQKSVSNSKRASNLQCRDLTPEKRQSSNLKSSIVSSYSKDKSQNKSSPITEQKILGSLQDSKWAQNIDKSQNEIQSPGKSDLSSTDCRIIKETRVKLQKNSASEQSGVVRLTKIQTSGCGEIELVQNEKSVVKEVISENSLFVTDANDATRATIIYKTVSKSKKVATWKITFQNCYTKAEFQKHYLNLRKESKIGSKQIPEKISPRKLTSGSRVKETSQSLQSNLFEQKILYPLKPTNEAQNFEAKTNDINLIDLDSPVKSSISSASNSSKMNTSGQDSDGTKYFSTIQSRENNSPEKRLDFNNLSDDLIEISDDSLEVEPDNLDKGKINFSMDWRLGLFAIFSSIFSILFKIAYNLVHFLHGSEKLAENSLVKAKSSTSLFQERHKGTNDSVIINVTGVNSFQSDSLSAKVSPAQSVTKKTANAKRVDLGNDTVMSLNENSIQRRDNNIARRPDHIKKGSFAAKSTLGTVEGGRQISFHKTPSRPISPFRIPKLSELTSYKYEKSKKCPEDKTCTSDASKSNNDNSDGSYVLSDITNTSFCTSEICGQKPHATSPIQNQMQRIVPSLQWHPNRIIYNREELLSLNNTASNQREHEIKIETEIFNFIRPASKVKNCLKGHIKEIESENGGSIVSLNSACPSESNFQNCSQIYQV